jgi:ERCC4-type nuclease
MVGDRQIIMHVDDREGGRGNRLESLCGYFRRAKIPFRTQNLPVADYIFVLREPGDTAEQGLVLPLLIERKTADDVGTSMKDGRMTTQKQKLRDGLTLLTGLVVRCALTTVLFF